MEAKPEVMPTPGSCQTRPTPTNQSTARGRSNDATRPVASASRASDARLSEDPMRRTDRYRLVMPYSLRV